MSCVKPITVNTPQGHFVVPCGKCLSCLKDRKNAWAFRMYWEARYSKTCHFVTLTYSPENMPRAGGGLGREGHIGTLRKKDLHTFLASMKRIQYRWYQEQGLAQPDYRIKYYAVGEYGTKTQRPHYHIIFFNLHPEMIKRIDKVWNKGHHHVGTGEKASMQYTAKYLIDKDERYLNQPIEKPFSCMSKNIGLEYLRANGRFHRDVEDNPEDWRMFAITEAGHKIALPRYYKEKLFSPDEQKYISELNQENNIARFLQKLEQVAKDNSLDPMTIEADRKYWERVRHKNDNIKTKSSNLNTL